MDCNSAIWVNGPAPEARRTCPPATSEQDEKEMLENLMRSICFNRNYRFSKNKIKNKKNKEIGQVERFCKKPEMVSEPIHLYVVRAQKTACFACDRVMGIGGTATPKHDSCSPCSRPKSPLRSVNTRRLGRRPGQQQEPNIGPSSSCHQESAQETIGRRAKFSSNDDHQKVQLNAGTEAANSEFECGF